jgi:hypothetical protein
MQLVILTMIAANELKKNSVYPAKLRNLVLTFASWYVNMAVVARTNGWYVSVTTLVGGYFWIQKA